ncbi:MAG: relaxase/mobilization nuclease and DUF3363 domain-containing protein [Alphaproteobacteria bacterium]|nr:relaxase/mobilization nuclease and DUF3363 domain-containing protein [Alphaproteobacteria bacterium]
MADDNEDIFKPKLGRIRSLDGRRAKSYLNQVLHQVSAAGKSSFGIVRPSRRFSGNRIGRGGGAMRQRRAGHRFGPSSRRVVIKTRIVKFKGGGVAAARAHLRYIQRDGVSKDNEPGRLYDAANDEADGKAFLERSEGDRHQFRFIVSPEDATELADLKPFVRDLIGAMEKDLGTRLDWVAVDHFNTEHPHTHIVLRGRDELGKDLVIARDYVAHGMRQQASELLTLELGPQTEQELRRKLERQVEQDRFTDLDRGLLREAGDGVLDFRHAPQGDDARFRRALQLGRLRALAKRGLAEETAPGQWRLSERLEETLRRAGERGDIIKTMHRGLARAGLDVGAADYAVYDPSDPRAPTVVGRIIDRGLHDELNDGHYVMIDGADGRVHHVTLDPKQDMDDLPMAAVVEVRPAAAGLKPADRIIAEVARANGGLYSTDAHHAADPQASDAYVQAHVRRLEALRRANIARRFPDGSWDVPDDFEDRVEALASKKARFPGSVTALSFLSLEAQVKADGATWLDIQLVAKEPMPLRGERFGAAAAEALHQREEQLIAQGLAKRDGQAVRYQRNLLKLLRQRELAAAGEKLSKEIGLSFVETQDGDRIEGIYRRPAQLASGKFAIIEKSKEFTLVPWRPVLERQRGQRVGGVMRGATASFDFGKKRGIGIS